MSSTSVDRLEHDLTEIRNKFARKMASLEEEVTEIQKQSLDLDHALEQVDALAVRVDDHEVKASQTHGAIVELRTQNARHAAGQVQMAHRVMNIETTKTRRQKNIQMRP